MQDLVSKPRSDGGLGCIYRPLPNPDFGLDAQIELAAEGEEGKPVATGQIISLQLKTGAPYFTNDDGETWSVYIAKSSVNYWRSHSVPVVLILVDLESKKAYWTRGDDSNHEEKESTYRIRVPKKQELDSSAYYDLATLAENTTEDGRRLARLEADLPLMLQALDGEQVVIDIQFWVNKSSGRMDYELGIPSGDSYAGPEDIEIFSSGTLIGTQGDLLEACETIAPWGTPGRDEDFEESMTDELYDRYLAETGSWDGEDGVYIDVLDQFGDWVERHRNGDASDALCYYEDGEIARYRFALTINDLGKSFALVYSHIHATEVPKLRRWRSGSLDK